MRKFKTIKTFALISALAALLMSCSHALNNSDNGEDFADGNTAILNISLSDSTARTISPVLNASDLKNFVLYKTSVDDANKVASWANQTVMENTSTRFAPGEYTLVLTAKAGGATFTGTQTVDLSEGDNTAAFNLSVSDYGTGTGTVDISITYPGTTVPSGTWIELVNMKDQTKAYSGKYKSIESDSDSKTKVNFKAEEIPAGVYRARVTAVVGEKKYVTCSEIVNVYEGCTSTGSYDCVDFVSNGTVYQMSEVWEESITHIGYSYLNSFGYNDCLIKGDKVTVSIDAIALTDINCLGFSFVDNNWVFLADHVSSYDSLIKAGQHFAINKEIEITTTSESTNPENMRIKFYSEKLEGETITSYKSSVDFIGSFEISVDKTGRENPVTITFDANGGTCEVESQTLYPGQLIASVSNPKKTGMLFNGWYDSKGKEYKIAPDSSVTLTAAWIDKVDFKDSINTNEEYALTIANSDLSKYPGGALNVKLSHKGEAEWICIVSDYWTYEYAYAEWTTDTVTRTIVYSVDDILEYLHGENLKFSGFGSKSKKTWTIDECYISNNTTDINYNLTHLNFELNGGSRLNDSGDPEGVVYYMAGRSISAVASSLTKDGCTFSKWVDADGNEVTTVPDEDCTIYAEWISNITTTFALNNGTTDTVEKQLAPGDTITYVPAYTGYFFAGWYDANGNAVTTAPSEAATLTAHWTDTYDFTGDIDYSVDNTLILKNEVLKQYPNSVLNIQVTHTKSEEDSNGNWVCLTNSWWSEDAIWTNTQVDDYTETIIVGVSDVLEYVQDKGLTFGMFKEGKNWTIDKCYLDNNSTNINYWITKIDFELDGGTRLNSNRTENTSKYYGAGQPIYELGTPTKDKYQFDHWVDADGNEVTTIPSEDCTLYAKWKDGYILSDSSTHMRVYNDEKGIRFDLLNIGDEYTIERISSDDTEYVLCPYTPTSSVETYYFEFTEANKNYTFYLSYKDKNGTQHEDAECVTVTAGGGTAFPADEDSDAYKNCKIDLGSDIYHNFKITTDVRSAVHLDDENISGAYLMVTFLSGDRKWTDNSTGWAGMVQCPLILGTSIYSTYQEINESGTDLQTVSSFTTQDDIDSLYNKLISDDVKMSGDFVFNHEEMLKRDTWSAELDLCINYNGLEVQKRFDTSTSDTVPFVKPYYTMNFDSNCDDVTLNSVGIYSWLDGSYSFASTDDENTYSNDIVALNSRDGYEWFAYLDSDYTKPFTPTQTWAATYSIATESISKNSMTLTSYIKWADSSDTVTLTLSDGSTSEDCIWYNGFTLGDYRYFNSGSSPYYYVTEPTFYSDSAKTIKADLTTPITKDVTYYY